MLTNFRNAIGTPVVAKEGMVPGMHVGKISDLVVDPKSGKIEAVWVKAARQLKIIRIAEIIHWNEIEFLIEEENDLSNPEELPGFAKSLEQECQIIGNTVVGKNSKSKLGKIVNFVFDTTAPKILSIRVKPEWFLFGFTRLIPRSRIIKIENHQVTIDDTEVKKVTEKEIKKKKDEFVSPVIEQ